MIFHLLLIFVFLNAFGLFHVEALQYLHEPVNDWSLRMVQNVRWNTSKNFMLVHRVDAKSMEAADPKNASASIKLGNWHIGEDPCPCRNDPSTCHCPLADADMSFFAMMGQDNMNIRFQSSPDGDNDNTCDIAIWPEEIVQKFIDDKTSFEEFYMQKCSFKRKIYKYEMTLNPKNFQMHVFLDKLHAFCPLDEHLKEAYPEAFSEYPKWIPANGAYNKPLKSPQCVYDFHKEAASQHEYEFFKYCAKGYFFQGKKYNDPARLSLFRKDWLLFLAQGQVICQQSGNFEEDRALVAKGYKLELIHSFDQHRFYPELELCPQMEAVLVSYDAFDNKNRNGDFLLAAIIGSAQLEGEFRWKYVDEGQKTKRRAFWDEKTFKDEYADMNLDTRQCYLLYHKMLQWNHGELKGRFRLQLRVTHYCTDRGMRKTTTFDVSVGPDQPPDNIYEDRGIQINLFGDSSYLERTTGQKLCQIGTLDRKNCDQMAPESESDKHLGEKEACQYGHDCGSKEAGTSTALRCHGIPSLSCSRVEGLDDKDHVKDVCKKETTCQKFAWDKPNFEPDSCNNNDLSCHDDEYCYTWKNDGTAYSECKKMRYKQRDEMCYVGAECFPPLKCKSTIDRVNKHDYAHRWWKFGTCEEWGQF